MTAKLYFLYSDILIWAIVFLGVASFLYGLRQAQIKQAWSKVWSRNGAQVAILILSIFMVTALLDSIHFIDNKTSRIYSLLDNILSHNPDVSERSYSAPLAIQSYVKETVENNKGQIVREHVLLKNVAPYLNDPIKQYKGDQLKLFLKANLIALILIGGLFFILYKRKYGSSSLSLLITISILIIIISNIFFFNNTYHLLGTDKIGEDVLYQAIKSIRTGIIIGTVTTLIMLPFALILGTMSGYFSGWIDDVIQYIYTTLSSIPGVLLIAAFVLVLQSFMSNNPEMFSNTMERADARLIALCLILGVTTWTTLCRLVRAETLKIKQMEYIQAAKALNVSNTMIIARHIIPNIMHIVLIIIALDFSGLVLAEAVLSYVGVGVDPITYSWGNMINQARLELARDPVVWWPLLASFSLMFTLVLFANIFADAVRDAFDPRWIK